MIESIDPRPFRSLACGCVIRMHNAGGGWLLFELKSCHGDGGLVETFWMAPCACVAFSDGVRLVCPRHSYLSQLMPMRRELQ
jgi:hypothetical protein